MKEVKVSVIIPVYNAENSIESTLSNVCRQTLQSIEILCVNDGSTDSSLALLHACAQKDSRIRVLNQENFGSGRARNYGLDVATGDYIAFMDADDSYPSDDVLEKLYHAAVTHRAKIVGGGIVKIQGGIQRTGEELGEQYTFAQEGFLQYKDLQLDYGFYRYLYAKNLLEEHSIRFPDYLRFQDPPFFVQAMYYAKKFYALPMDTYLYRQGHQTIDWSFRKVNDLVRGLRDNLKFSREHNLVTLHKNCVERLNTEYLWHQEHSLREGNAELPFLLYETYQQFNPQWVPSTPLIALQNILDGKYLKEQCSKLQEQLEQKEEELQKLRRHIYGILHSTTWQVGRVATYAPRKAKELMHCCQDHGLKHTMWQSLVHLGLKEPKNPPAKK